MFSYSNGTYILTDELTLPVASDPLGTFRGYRIFTAMRTTNGRVFHLDDHLDRIFDSAKALYMEIRESKEELRRFVEETVDRNKGQYEGDLLVEILYSGGEAGDTMLSTKGAAHLYVLIFQLASPAKEWYEKGIALATFPYQRQWPEIKLLNYIGGVLAHQTVVKEHKAVDALFVSPNDKQTILEGTTFNFFVVKDRMVITPSTDGKILKGITRKIVVDLAHKKEIAVDEDYILLNELHDVDEAFITSSTRGVVPVVRVDNVVIGDGKPGKLTAKLMAFLRNYLEGY